MSDGFRVADTWRRYFRGRPVAELLDGRDLSREPCLLAIELLEEACEKTGDRFNDDHLADVTCRLEDVLRQAA